MKDLDKRKEILEYVKDCEDLEFLEIITVIIKNRIEFLKITNELAKKLEVKL